MASSILIAMLKTKSSLRCGISDRNENIEVEIRTHNANFCDVLYMYMTRYPFHETRERETVCVFHNVKDTVLRLGGPEPVLKNTLYKSKHGVYTIVMSSERVVNDIKKGKMSLYTQKTYRDKQRYIFVRKGYEVHFTIDNETTAYIEIEFGGEYNEQELDEDLINIAGKGLSPCPDLHELTRGVRNGMKIQKPVDLTKEYFRRDKYLMEKIYVTPKVDGQRTFICLYDGNVIAINTRGHKLLIDKVMDKRIYVIDCERVNSSTGGYKYLAFDLLVFRGDDLTITMNDYAHRHNMLGEVPKINCVDIKNYAVCKTYNELAKCIQWTQRDKSRYDGVIIYESDKPYTNIVYKYKFESTIDVYTNGIKSYVTGVDELMELKNIAIENYPFKGTFHISECNYVNGHLLHQRMRFDKSTPNNILIYSNITTPGNLLSVDMMIGKVHEPFFMRVYHNVCKSIIVETLVGNLLDVGSGNGGDIHKWKHNPRLTSVHCIEPNPVHRAELDRRLKQVGYSKAVVFDSSIQTYSGESRYDVATMFFCINDIPDIDNAMHRVYSLLRKSGVLHIMFMDNVVHGNNDVYSIINVSHAQYTIKLKGTIISDHTEYKINNKTLMNICRHIGFEINTVCNLDNPWLSVYERELSRMYTYMKCTKP
jgi:hypothetical protein